MAIKIPSSSIYDISVNNKVIDNKIEVVNIGAVTPKLEKNYSTTIYQEKVYEIPEHDSSYDSNYYKDLYGENKYYGNAKLTDLAFHTTTSGSGASAKEKQLVSYVEQQTGFLKNINITIPKNNKNTRIIQLFTGADNNGNNNISYTVKYRVNNYYVDGTLFVPLTGDDYVFVKNVTYQEPIGGANYGSGNIPKKQITEIDSDNYLENEIVCSHLNDGRKHSSDNNYALAKVIEKDITNTEIVSSTSDNENFYINNIILFSGVKRLWLTCSRERLITFKYSNTEMSGGAIKYIPQSVEISFNGNLISLNLENKTITIGESKSKKVYSLSGNELMQTTNIPSVESRYQSVINQYKNGKETATIRCQIGEYYDENGIKKISTSESGLPMKFNSGNIVIPYVYCVDGQDRPMSAYSDGKPKKFQVCQVKMIYDGAVWQELTLQEYKEVAEDDKPTIPIVPTEYFTLKFYLDKRDIGSEDIYMTIKVAKGETAQPIPNPPNISGGSGEIYAFNGWYYTQGEQTYIYDFSMSVISDMDIYAVYKYIGTEA